MPHCPRPLYESLLAHIFGDKMRTVRWMVLGNTLADYVLDHPVGDAEGFAKAKKKRKGRGPNARPRTDGILQRLGTYHGQCGE
jgi:hypothetical protein